jgi:hypothetical protein
MRSKITLSKVSGPHARVWTLLYISAFFATRSMAQSFPEPNPPVFPFQEETGAEVQAQVEAPSAAPTTEWTNH